MPTHRALFSGAFVLASLAGAPAQAQLAKTSPFMPPAGAATTAPTAGAPLEFRGWIQTADGILFRLRDPARKADTWVKMNEHDSALDVTPKQHDLEKNTLTIEYQGRTLTLAVREAKIVSSGSAAQPVPMPAAPAPAANVSPAVTQSVVVNPSPADEQRRLEAVAAEVARRRALREQAAQQSAQNPGQPPQLPGQPPQMPGQQFPTRAVPTTPIARPGQPQPR